MQVQEERLLGWSVGVRILFLAVGMVKEFNSRAGIAACLKVGGILQCVSSYVNEFGITCLPCDGRHFAVFHVRLIHLELLLASVLEIAFK